MVTPSPQVQRFEVDGVSLVPAAAPEPERPAFTPYQLMHLALHLALEGGRGLRSDALKA